MKTERFDKTRHLPIIIEWWAHYYEGDIFPEYCVPKHGIFVTKDGEPVGSIFVYINDSNLCHVAFPIINPEAGFYDKSVIISHLVEAAKELCQKLLGDKAVIFGITHNSGVATALLDAGFVNNDVMRTFAYAIGEADIEFLK